MELQEIIEAELAAPLATVRLARYDFDGPCEGMMPPEADLRLDLSLTPRIPNARLSFCDHWAPHRFERPGKVFLVPPGEMLCARSDSGRQASVICLLHPAAITRWLALDWTDRLIDASVDIPGAIIPALLGRLGEEARRPGFASEALCEAIAAQIAIEIGRYYIGVAEQKSGSALPPWRLRLIDQRIHDQETPPTLSELADLCGISVRQLTRGFRASRGRSIGDHIADRRMEMAKAQLLTDRSVKTIAFAMGFRSPSSFCHAFRKATGQTPQQYRQLMLS
ncbi:MAG TPA: helix-turn-helix transcriptional regulator [Sphingobium sp.]